MAKGRSTYKLYAKKRMGSFALGKVLCRACGKEVRAGREVEHRECRQRAAEAAGQKGVES